MGRAERLAPAAAAVPGATSAADGKKRISHDAASIRASQQKSGTAEVKVDEQSMNTLRVNLQLTEMLAIQGTPATLTGDDILVGAVSWDVLEEWVKQQLAKSDAG